MSKLEALALRVEERRSTSESAEVDEAEERPDRLRSRLRLKARSASEPEQPFSDVSKLANGQRPSFEPPPGSSAASPTKSQIRLDGRKLSRSSKER